MEPATGRLPGGLPAAHADERTREKVLRHVLAEGPVAAVAVASALGLTATGVRRHIDALVDSGLIAATDIHPARKGRGRPARAYVVTPAGHMSLTSQYDDVATDALRFLAEQIGPQAITEFARRRLAVDESRYAALVQAAGSDTTARAEALARALAEDGFAATARPVDSTSSPDAARGVQLCQGHCPMHHVAQEFPQFCDAETETFSRILGVHVQRLATLAGGEHVCTTYVPTIPVRARAETAPSNERTSR